MPTDSSAAGGPPRTRTTARRPEKSEFGYRFRPVRGTPSSVLPRRNWRVTGGWWRALELGGWTEEVLYADYQHTVRKLIAMAEVLLN